MSKQHTYSNPLDLNYDYRTYGDDKNPGPICLEAADPVMVIFEGEYYLFTSITHGYWVSPDMSAWEFIPCDNSQLPEIYSYAPAVMVLDGAIYFHQGVHDKRLFRNKTPRDPNAWELVTDNCYVGHDPFMFYDEIEDRVWASYGCGPVEEEAIKIVELDRKTLEPIGEVVECFMADPANHGWERRFDDMTVEERGWTEGSQILRHNDKWYMIYSGFSLHKSYANGVYVADDPKGPYTYAQNNPISHKNTGFIGGAGHGCVFQDLHGNWWNVTCASIQVSHHFERRINLFPAGFDEDGNLFVNTALGDYAIVLPDGKRDHSKLQVKHMLLSKDCKVTASSVETAMPEDPLYGEELLITRSASTRYRHDPAFAADEDIRTLWAASSRAPGQWLMLDLGRLCSIKSIQLNLHTYNLTTQATEEKYYEFLIEASADGEHFDTLYNNRGKHLFQPHGYYEVDSSARFVRVTFFHIAGNGFAAISGLRVFGSDGSALPAAPQNVRLARPAADTRCCTLCWDAVPGAEGYLIRYGIAPDKLYNMVQTYETAAQVRTLSKGISYSFRVDSFNAAGVTEGTVSDMI